MQKIISSGAEAVIYLEGSNVVKKRVSKFYRLPELDRKIIRARTKSERKILKRAHEIIASPLPDDGTEFDEITMPFINGEKLSATLNSYPQKKQEKILEQIGKKIAKLHDAGIVHGDLTTSNMILKNGEVFLIDFGLGSFNGKYEQKGVDIHLLRQALEAKHFKNYKKLFVSFKKGYENQNASEAEKVFERLKVIEKRGRYKH